MIRTLNFFQNASTIPPSATAQYLCYCADGSMRILWYNTKTKTWTTEDISADRAFSKCFDRKVLAWSNLAGTMYALSKCNFE